MQRARDLLTVSIVTYGIDGEELLFVLENLNLAIRKLIQQESAMVSVKIIDNAQQSNELQKIISKVQQEYVSYELISGHGNIGYGRANNLAIETIESRFHLILNPDVILEQDCLMEGISYLKRAEAGVNKEKVSAVSPAAKDKAGNSQFLCKRYPSVLDLLLRGFAPDKIKKYFRKRLDRYELKDRIKKNQNETVKNVPLISGCFMLCNTDILKKVGGFDERFFLHFEDCALSIELKKHGNLNYLPNMRIIHFGGNSAKKGFKHIVIFIRSGIRFFNIYGWKFI